MLKDNMQQEKPTFFPDYTLPTLVCDVVRIHLKNDGSALLRILSRLPEGEKEEARFMVTGVTLRAFLDVTCQLIDYYPAKKEKKEK